MSALTTRRQDAIRGAAIEMMVPPERARELFSRRFGRSHDVVFFPSRDTVVC